MFQNRSDMISDATDEAENEISIIKLRSISSPRITIRDALTHQQRRASLNLHHSPTARFTFTFDIN